MNYLLGLVLGLLLLVAVYHWFNQNKQSAPVVPPQEPVPMIYNANHVAAPPMEEPEMGEPQEPEMDSGEAVPGQAHHYPMEEQMGYPSGILPGKVGTFHPTKSCNRFLCAGCGGAGSNTDDSGRNYPDLIDRIRAKQTDEYPFYKLG